jgi:hypothetical protein
MRRFLAFLAAAGVYGVASVLIAAILLGISIFEHARDKNVVAYIFVVTAALAFCVGAFIAWLEENKKYEAEKAKHDAPNFRLQIESIITKYELQTNLTSLCFAADVVNRGAPSHAQGWHVRYQSHSIDITVKYISLVQDRAEIPLGGNTLILKRLDLLPARTLATIERGQLRHGRILFEIPGDRRQEIYSGNAVMWIGCFDNADRLCQAPFKSTAEIPVLKTYPDEEVV